MSRTEARPARLLHRVLFVLLVAQLGAMMLGWNLVSPVLQLLFSPQRGAAVGRAAISRIFRIFVASAEAAGMMRIDTAALDALRDEPGGLIVAANHPTMLDALVLSARLPRSVCVMKAELMRNVFLGAGSRLARYIRNDSPRTLIRDSVGSLRSGGQLVLFPEGTRTVAGAVDAFRPGVTLIAQQAQVPIQTVIIETASPYLRKGWPLLRVPPVPIVMRARLGARFAPEADHRALLRRLQTYFQTELAP